MCARTAPWHLDRVETSGRESLTLTATVTSARRLPTALHAGEGPLLPRQLTSIVMPFQAAWGMPDSRVMEGGAFVSKQPLLALDPTAIAGKTCVGADDAVTRDHDGDRVGTIGKTDGAN